MTRRIASLCLASLLALAPAARAQVNITVDATSTVRVVDDRQFGMNTPFWDGSFSDGKSTDTLSQMNTRIMRFGGGSATDQYNWATGKDVVSGTQWAVTVDTFAAIAKAVGSQGLITTNYGSGLPADAAAYVQHCNISMGYGFKYWEIGNECYGTWEYDTNTNPHDPYTYATRAVKYINAMRAVDPTIKIGVVATPGEDSYSNGYTSNPATNPRTNSTHNGWVPVMLATMKAAGVLPDFIIDHRYEQNAGSENDATLLQASVGTYGWAFDATNLRQMLTDYLGSSGNSIEILVTENNSVNTNPGKQSTSLVNGLYLADSTGNLLQTEINSLVWWDFHNGQDTTQNNSASLYGWRLYGDYGIESAAHDRYPTFYVSKLLSHFARGGDTVIKAVSSSTLLSAYAVKRLDGSLSLLVINKSPTATQSASIAVTGFTPKGAATVYTYGMTQDTAAQTAPGSAAADVAVSTLANPGASFTSSFTPYSVTLVSLAGPTSAPVATSQPASQTIAAGGSAAFTFGVTGAPTPTYQWYLNGSAVPGATSATLLVSGATSASAGTYTCTATNSVGTVTSGGAALSVVNTSDPGRLINLSCRAAVGTGSNLLIAGFAVGPLGAPGSEPLLIRASGPALIPAPFSVSGTIPDPELKIYSGSNQVAENHGWGGDAGIAATAASVGAFPWSLPAGKDAAILASETTGAYTAQVSGYSSDTGVALAEVYDATPKGTYTPSTPRLVNLSTRVQVGTGSNILIAGFVIGGTTAKTVLIRASGPAIAAAPFNVTGTLADPTLKVIDQSGNMVASNSGWGGDPSIESVAASVGAFAWSNPSSLDSAILVTLPPGAYTAQVAGAAGTATDTGVALVEVYDVP